MELENYKGMLADCGLELPEEAPIDEEKLKEYFFHNTQYLLEKYTAIRFQISRRGSTLDKIEKQLPEEYPQLGKDLLKSVLREMAADELFKRQLDNYIMLEQIDLAMEKLKEYPEFGEIYYNILLYSYMQQDSLPTYYVMKIKSIGLGHSTFFKYKKKAIEVLSSILWGDDGLKVKSYICPVCHRKSEIAEVFSQLANFQETIEEC